jgi:four helix bundle protein
MEVANYKTYKDLDVWIKARILVGHVYRITTSFPKEELYGLTSQIRRCAISIPSNIAEGYGRQYKKETLQFLHIARGSLYELETQLYISFDLKFISENELNGIVTMIEECRKLLSGLIRYFENNNNLK